MFVPLLELLIFARIAAIGEGGAVAEIQVFNRVGIPEGTYDRAVQHAQELFDKAGIPTHWQRCPNPRTVPKEKACPVILTAFLLGVVKEDKKLHSQSDSFTIGYTLRTAGRNNAAVIWPRVQNFSILLGINSDLLLGYAMAHEIGHLLSPVGHHSIGVMDPSWDRDDAIDMARGRLMFCDRDAESMRREVQRMARAGASYPQTHAAAAP
ncbi:MAG: hypothetical protein JST93_11445 [Acidobacteria bacterium]|nr:hypothetical protein [Acidobacteriota bacterium]